MEILIHSCLEGAKNATGIAVIFDIFRASNTIIACLESGAASIIPVAGIEEACAQKTESNVLIGERKGLQLEGFDYGNSPANAAQLNLGGKEVVITTAAGSQGIVNAQNADEILIGGFTNAQAIIDYIKSKNPAVVSLVAIGLEAHAKADEDEACAQYVKEQLLGEESNFEKLKEKSLQGDGAARLRRLNQLDDLEWCMQLDVSQKVPKFVNGKITA